MLEARKDRRDEVFGRERAAAERVADRAAVERQGERPAFQYSALRSSTPASRQTKGPFVTSAPGSAQLAPCFSTAARGAG